MKPILEYIISKNHKIHKYHKEYYFSDYNAKDTYNFELPCSTLYNILIKTAKDTTYYEWEKHGLDYDAIDDINLSKNGCMLLAWGCKVWDYDKGTYPYKEEDISKIAEIMYEIFDRFWENNVKINKWISRSGGATYYNHECVFPNNEGIIAKLYGSIRALNKYKIK